MSGLPSPGAATASTIGRRIEGGDLTVNATRRPATYPVVRVHCAEVPASLPAGTVARWIRDLPPPQASRLARRLTQGTGMESLTVLALLASLRPACRLPSISRLQWTDGGKPHFPRGPAFSLTHSRRFAACAVAPHGLSIGIDIEPADRARAAAVRLVATAAEQSALDDGSLTPTGLWTAKEAVLKAAGAGLSEIGNVAIRDRRARFAGIDYCWRHFRPRGGLLLAIATRGRLPAVSIDWPPPHAIFGRPPTTRKNS